MKLREFLVCAAVASLISGVACAQTAAPAGYLAPGEAPDSSRILPAPPADDSGRKADDQAIFNATRALKDDPRWDLAASDADLHPEHGAADFACAIGVTLDATNAPTVLSILKRTSIDARAVVDPAKDHFARPRPIVSAPEDAPICVPKSNDLKTSASYPSGHSTISWAWGLILAELAPDRATEVLMRARSVGESRIVCGVHWLSDVQAGRDNGALLVARLHASPEFRADLDKARAEIQTARETPHVGPEACLVQDQAAAHPPY